MSRARWAVVLILLVAATLRLVGIGRGSPEMQPDEPVMVESAALLLEGARPDVILGWPGTPQQVGIAGIFAVDLVLRRGGDLFAAREGGVEAVASVLDEHFAELYLAPRRFYVMARSLTVLLGLLTVLLVQRVTARLTGSDWWGVGAAAVVATDPLHTGLSRLAVADAPAAFGATLLLWLAVRYVEKPTRRALWWTAFCAGFACAFKFNVGAMALPAVVVLVALRGPEGMSRRSRAGTLLGVATLGLLVGCPYLVTDLMLVLKDFLWRNAYQQGVTGLGGRAPQVGWFVIGGGLATGAYGAAMSVLLPIGLVQWARRREDRRLLTAGVIAVGYLVLLGASSSITARWMLLVVPYAAVLGVAGLAAWHARLASGSRWRVVPFALVAVLCVFGGARSWPTGGDVPTSRENLRVWLAEHVPADAAIAFGMYAERPLPLSRRGLLEDRERLLERMRSGFDEGGDAPAFLHPAMTNEESFELQRIRHLLRAPEVRGYRVRQYGTKRRFADMLADVENGWADVVILASRVSYDANGTPAARQLAADLAALRAELTSRVGEPESVDGRFAIYRLNR